MESQSPELERVLVDVPPLGMSLERNVLPSGLPCWNLTSWQFWRKFWSSRLSLRRTEASWAFSLFFLCLEGKPESRSHTVLSLGSPCNTASPT